jgi:murein DD-endopeptidase MepM/ murein hydrolase activator NlpD
VIVLLAAGCATLEEHKLYRDTRDMSVKAAELVADTTAKAVKRMQRYLAEKEVLQKFHDAGEHSETAVLDVLHKAGVGQRTAQSPPKTPKPGKGGAKQPSTSTPAPSSPAFPAQYAGGYRWPLDAGVVSSEYGKRWGKLHKGIDIAADVGEPVFACASGEVIYAGDGLRGYGNVVILRHDNQRTSLYAHNSELKVKQGEQVKQGDLIALLGNTGHSTGPHTHFEIRNADATVDPRSVLPKAKFDVAPQQPKDAAAAQKAGV